MFGGSEATQSTQSTSTPKDMTPEDFKNLRPELAAELSKYMKAGGTPDYSGPLTTNMGANEGTVLGHLMNQTGPGTSRNALLEKTIAGGFLPGSEGANPFLDAAIRAAQRPTMEGLTETLTRDLPGRFTAAGQFTQPQGTSAFDRAAAIATRGAANAMSDIATNMSFGAYESERGRQQEAVPLSRAEVEASVTNLQAQALPRLIQELGIDRGLQLFQLKTQSLLDILKTIAGVSSPTIANQQQSSGYGQSTSDKGVIPGLFPKGF